MRDFTHSAYTRYIEAIKEKYPAILRFDEYFLANPRPDSFCLLRHDVDRLPSRALQMARIERELGIQATYYFRTKWIAFDASIITTVHELGHEVGYHYECLSDSRGDLPNALDDFRRNLERLRALVPVRTVAMHGRPFSRFDNRDLWCNETNRQLLVSEFGILGEVYLDIDYTDIAYISDTGRNWSPGRSNRRDKVATRVGAQIEDRRSLLGYLRASPHPRLALQVHPERWTAGLFSWALQWGMDAMVNLAKRVV